MTRDDIIRMAREANPGVHMGKFPDDIALIFERFAALVAAAERQKVAAWMIERSYATGHGDTAEDLLKEMEWQVRESEREACAALCDEMEASPALSDIEKYRARFIGDAIRARGDSSSQEGSA